MKVQVSHRLDGELLSWATEYGEARGSSRAVVIEEALRHFRDLSSGGVPDLPFEPKSAARVKPRPAVKPVPGVRRAREFVLNPRQERLNRAKGS